MSELNAFWQNYRLRLKRENSEYTYGDWYNHNWNEFFDIKEGLDKTKRGERIRIDFLTEEQVGFTFFDHKTSNSGVEGVLSLQAPSISLRSENQSGGRNEYAWKRVDYVTLFLEERNENEKDSE